MQTPFLDLIYQHPGLQTAHLVVKSYEPQKASYADLNGELHFKLKEKLDELGFHQLYRHQVLCHEAAMQGKDIMLVTPTSSGKTLCYNLPVLQTCLTEPMGKALYIFPTKALAQDQLKKLEEFIPQASISCGLYDGDTPKTYRSMVRNQANIVLTNPDMLHLAILPQHENWGKFLRSLRWIVIDELHTYEGVFGSHVASILKRLLRLCEWYKSYPKIIACSATIQDPAHHFEQLTGRPPKIIQENGAPQSERTVVLAAPVVDEASNSFSSNLLTADLLTRFCLQGYKTLVFCKSRLATELVLKQAQSNFKKQYESPKLVDSYRGGYTPESRRKIEEKFRNGELRGLVATTAMELGVDIGGLDIVIMNGYPGTKSSFWQQVGRSGRASKPGYALMIAHADPMEQYLVNHPELLLDSETETSKLNPSNRYILDAQLQCAAYERAIASDEISQFGKTAYDEAESLVNAGELAYQSNRYYYPTHNAPAVKVSIRGLGGPQIDLYDGSKKLGSIEYWRALQSAHEGAIYLQQGTCYLVQKLNLDQKSAELGKVDVDYYTQPVTQSVVQQTMEIEQTELQQGKGSLVGLTLTQNVIAYQQISLQDASILQVNDLNLPATQYETMGFRLDLPLQEPYVENLGDSVHGVEHALLALAPIFAECNRNDLGSSWYTISPDTLKPAVFIFDQVPGGVGLSEKLYKSQQLWLSAALDLLQNCACESGCPQCLYSSKCEIKNQHLDKQGTIRLLASLL